MQPELNNEERRIFARMMDDARERCNLVADGEKVLGYDSSADTYRQMAIECRWLKEWMLALRSVSGIPLAAFAARR